LADGSLLANPQGSGVPFKHRGNSIVPPTATRIGAAFIYSKFSDRVRAFDHDQMTFTGMSVPLQDFEANLDLTYLAQIKPGGGCSPTFNTCGTPTATRNATVLGVRSLVRY
jgi:porin